MIWFLHHLAERFVALWLIGLNLHFETIRWYTYRYLPIDLVIDGFPTKVPSTDWINSAQLIWLADGLDDQIMEPQWGDHGWSMIKPPNHSRIKNHEISSWAIMKCIMFIHFCLLPTMKTVTQVELIRAAPWNSHFASEAVTKGEPRMNLADFKVQRMAQLTLGRFICSNWVVLTPKKIDVGKIL